MINLAVMTGTETVHVDKMVIIIFMCRTPILSIQFKMLTLLK